MQRLDGTTGGWQSIKAKIAEIVRRVNAMANIRITRSGSTDTVTVTENGIVINMQNFPRQGASVGGGGYIAHDFQLLGIGTETLTIRRGYANTDLAEISTTPLAIDPADNELTFTATGDTEFWLTYTSTGGDLDDPDSTKTLTIVSADPGADSATEANKPLGSVTADSGVLTVVNSHLTGSQDVESCGSSHTWRRS